ncbi:MAG: elongation factor G [Calditrichaeota bacterium]|nr:MAG: elongation factor G [Calditrichota bacterium]
MKEYSTEKIRNVALISHATVGKSSLAEAMLYSAKAINRMGTIDDGSTVSDYHVDEINRKFSISTSLLHCIWNDSKINIVDTPGYSDFIGEVVGALGVVETAVVLINAVAGVEVGTETTFKYVTKKNVSSVFFVNLCDKEHSSFENAVSSIQESFGAKAIPVQIAVNCGEVFNKIIDLLQMKLITFDSDGKASIGEIPDNLKDQANAARETLVEAIAEADDALLEKFFDEGELSDEDITSGLQKGIISGTISPILAGAAAQAMGSEQLLDFIATYCPSPGKNAEVKGTETNGEGEVNFPATSDSPLAVQVFKTISEQHLGELTYFRVYSGRMQASSEVYNSSRNKGEKIGQLYVMNGKKRTDVTAIAAGDIGAAVKLKDTHTGNTLCLKTKQLLLPEIEFPQPVIRTAIEPKKKGEEDKIATGLATLHEEDPTFIVTVDPELHQTILSGQGELHLDVIIRKLTEKYHVEVELIEPKIPYRETIRKKAEGQSKYKKQSGGRGQYGDVHLRLEPMKRGDGFEFLNEIVGGVVPGKFIPAVEKGVVEATVAGVISGCPVVDVKVALFYGSYHNVDSSDMAFKIAASMGFRKLFKEADPVLLEPIYNVEIRVPEEYMGDVMGDISSRRGKIAGMDAEGKFQVIKAQVPLAELYKYSTTLRSITHGRGIHSREFSHYEETPRDVQKKVTDAYEAERENN